MTFVTLWFLFEIDSKCQICNIFVTLLARCAQFVLSDVLRVVILTSNLLEHGYIKWNLETDKLGLISSNLKQK